MRAQDEGISAVAAALCWKKVGQKDAVAVWQKRADDSCFAGKKGEERRRRLACAGGRSEWPGTRRRFSRLSAREDTAT
ncbi:hypothetical protein CLOP_g21662 [Closterium sp. NIES-67]|nr:hypothetical protein CLOP_g21662 [Closterium sp. NIES-67]